MVFEKINDNRESIPNESSSSSSSSTNVAELNHEKEKESNSKKKTFPVNQSTSTSNNSSNNNNAVTNINELEKDEQQQKQYRIFHRNSPNKLDMENKSLKNDDDEHGEINNKRMIQDLHDELNRLRIINARLQKSNGSLQEKIFEMMKEDSILNLMSSVVLVAGSNGNGRNDDNVTEHNIAQSSNNANQTATTTTTTTSSSKNNVASGKRSAFQFRKRNSFLSDYLQYSSSTFNSNSSGTTLRMNNNSENQIKEQEDIDDDEGASPKQSQQTNLEDLKISEALPEKSSTILENNHEQIMNTINNNERDEHFKNGDKNHFVDNSNHKWNPPSSAPSTTTFSLPQCIISDRELITKFLPNASSARRFQQKLMIRHNCVGEEKLLNPVKYNRNTNSQWDDTKLMLGLNRSKFMMTNHNVEPKCNLGLSLKTKFNNQQNNVRENGMNILANNNKFLKRYWSLDQTQSQQHVQNRQFSNETFLYYRLRPNPFDLDVEEDSVQSKNNVKSSSNKKDASTNTDPIGQFSIKEFVIVETPKKPEYKSYFPSTFAVERNLDKDRIVRVLRLKTSSSLNAIEKTFKVIMVGDSTVGKTSLIFRAKHGAFRSNPCPTIGIDFQTIQIQIENDFYDVQLWDTAGQERYRSITRNYFRRVDAICMVYDMFQLKTFFNVRDWLTAIRESVDCKPIPLLLIANKCDLRESQSSEHSTEMVPNEEAIKLINEIGHDQCGFIETSCKTGENVDEAIIRITRMIIMAQQRLSELNQDNQQTQQSNGGVICVKNQIQHPRCC